MSDPAPEPIRRLDYRPPDYLIDEVGLDIRLDPRATRVVATLRFRRGAGAGPRTPLRLDGEDLALKGLRLDGRRLGPRDFELRPDCLILFEPPAQGSLTIETEIDPQANTKLEGLYRSNGVYCTQCEAEGFRRITFFPDRPDVLARYRTRIEAPAGACPVLLSNGNLVEQGPAGEGRHFALWDDPFPKPCYLFALVAGDLARVGDRFITASGRNVAVNIFVEPGKQDRAGYALDALRRAMRWDERVYGLEYDLDVFNIVAVSDFNMGAMENKSLNLFNDKYILVDPETATDADYANVESVVAHEYFHNWTGNRVTCRDWFQLSLKEGLTVFRDQCFSSDERGAAVKRIQDVALLRARQFPEDAGPLAHPVRPDSYIEINNFYTATVYEKGAEVIRMLRTLLGQPAFIAGVRLYLERHDGTAATCDDFVTALADASGRDLAQFRRWYGEVGTPRVTVRPSLTRPPVPWNSRSAKACRRARTARPSRPC